MLLEADNLYFAYNPGSTVLHGVSLTLERGETLFVLGKNGCGKTTLLSCLSGILSPISGKVMMEGKTLTDFSPAERAQSIALIPQFHTPTFAYTVRQLVLMGRAPYLSWMDAPSRRDEEIVDQSLEQVGLFDLRDRPYTEISGGEQQLVLIARGLAQSSSIILMDEPTAHLDLSNQYRVLEIIHQLGQQGLSFIISSHSPNDALTYADKVLLISGGWVIDYGKPQETLTEPLLSSVYGIQTEVFYQKENGESRARAVLPLRPNIVEPDSINTKGSFLNEVFQNRKNKSQMIIVTGLSGAGKTTWCKNLVENAKANGYVVEGILSPGIFEGKRKIGIEVLDLHTGEKKQLAKLREGRKSEISTPRWVFDPQSLEWANQRLENGSGSDLLIIDELGPLEFLRNEGLLAGLKRLDQGEFQVACVVVRSSLLQKAIERWPYAYVVSGRL